MRARVEKRSVLGWNKYLVSTKETQLVLSYQYTVGAPVCSAKASMYLHITLVFFTALYMHLIYPSVE